MVLVSVGVIGAEVLEVLISLAAMLGFLATIVVSTSRGGSRDGSSDDRDGRLQAGCGIFIHIFFHPLMAEPLC